MCCRPISVSCGRIQPFQKHARNLGNGVFRHFAGWHHRFVPGVFRFRQYCPRKICAIYYKIFACFERVTPSLIIILIFIIALGIGSFAGTCALIVGTIGTFGKLFSDAIEQVERGPVDAIYSTGANRLQAIRYGILPQAIPSIIANWFYALDVNIRLAIALGIFGGGGIGFELYMAMKVLRYKEALAMIFFTIILVSSIEKISDYFRRRIINNTRIS
ncbi:MAG: ABC transporter permease subunit [Bacteroidales bacterium]|nr:ABC transporter permease subunit [Bacteroidales bacterium]